MANKKTIFKYDLSIAMIVKNEEKCLRKSLESMLPLRDEISCQLIITDTGSTDATVSIAKEYADVFLEFEWCDDFAAARNTGVTAAEGRWFMYVDADEYFDETIMEIAKFVKSSEANNCSYASLINRSYTDEKFTSFSDSNLPRLVNFEKGKQQFIGSVHEVIYIDPAPNNPALDTIMHHTGYIGTRANKTQRNEELINLEIEKNPHDLRYYLLKVENVEDSEEAIQVCGQALDMAKKTNQMNSVYIEFLHVVYCKNYSKLKQFDKLYAYAADYLEHEKRILISRQEILYLTGSAYYNNKDFKNALSYLKLYMESYEKMQVNFDNIYSMFGVYNCNNEKIYNAAALFVGECYIKLNMVQEGIAHMQQIKAYAFVNSVGALEYYKYYLNLSLRMKQYSLVRKTYEEYKHDPAKRIFVIDAIEKSIKEQCDAEQLIVFYEEFGGGATDGYTALHKLRSVGLNTAACPETAELLRADDLLYKSPVFMDAFYATYIAGNDVYGFCEELSMNKLHEYIFGAFRAHPDCAQRIYGNLIGRASSGYSPKITAINSYSAYVFVVQAASLQNPNVEQVSRMFDYFVTNSYKTISELYNMDKFENYLQIVPTRDVFCYYAHAANSLKVSNPVEYIRNMRKAVKYNESLKNCVTLIIEDYKQQLDRADDARTEFLLLGEQVKGQIKSMISQGNATDALAIIKQYSSINPTDHEIADLYEQIEAMQA